MTGGPPIVPNWQHPPDGALTVFVVYQRTSECTGPYYVVTPWTVSSSGQVAGEPVGAATTLSEVRDLIPPWADYRYPRSANDAPDIVETWL